ncbi:4-(cytidine 5'-diphospho)-2-C-methyl-D-erythritol kinase [Pseudothermotoga sp.]|uniref:4-(cytidine 5'-diphospho)-2-C-methyl-D-erythritol kinase n=1 Tax=Pseudothermotoga sp. TaxID=2033661 RepID=UPI0031F6BF9E
MVEVDVGFSERAYAKLNLYLDVVARRPDGYHDIVGLFQTISLHDELLFFEIEKTKGIIVECNVPIEGQNLVEKAYRVFNKYHPTDFGLKVVLKKRIPMGAGLGGGSSDAAATLRFLAKKLKVSNMDLLQIASEVGSDVPFLLFGGTAIVEGKGEKITPLKPITGYGVDLFCPNVSVSTALAYRMLKEEDFNRGPKPIEKLYEAYLKHDFEAIKALSYNIFQELVCNMYEEIKRTLLKAWTTNPIVAQLTGTGGCVFSVRESGGDHVFC